MSLPAELIARRDSRHGSRLGDIIRRLASDSDGERIAAVEALDRVLGSAGRDFHDFADHLEANGSGISETDMRKIFDAGYAKGVEATEAKYHGAHDFHNADGKPAWEGVALFLQRNKDRLDPKHHEFINDMAARTAWGNEPTERQHKYLHSLFYKLGGKIT
jgi:hypothetical protein